LRFNFSTNSFGTTPLFFFCTHKAEDLGISTVFLSYRPSYPHRINPFYTATNSPKYPKLK
jgi:hypothetical protein